MTDKIFVIHTDGSKEPFKPRMISQTIMDETGVKQDLADRIQDRIAKKIYKLKQNEGLMEISTSDLRAEVSSHLLREGEFDAVEQNRKLGMSVSEFEDLLQNGCKDNANIGYTPEMVAKYAYDSIAKEYSLLKMPEHCSKAHIDGYIHIHDLEYLETRPNCLSGNNNIIIKDEDNNISYTTIKEFVEEMFLSDKTYYVPSLNIETNSMEWKRIENAYLSSPSEETYLVTFSKGYSIECTSDHKFVKSHNNKPQKEYNIKVSEFDNYKDLRLCNITDLKENNDLNDYNKSALFGFFLGDGYISNKGNVKFSFSKKDKAEYLYALLERLNIDFTYTEKESNHYDTGCLYSFYIKDKIYPQLSKSKLIKKYTSKYNLTGILEGLINSDGHVRLDINNILRLNFTNTNKSIFDLYQLCLISNGIRGSINITEFSNPNHKDAYNSSSFGEKVISLLTSITLCNRFTDSIKQYNKKVKQYKDIGELRPKSIEYSGEQPVYNLTIEDNHNYMAGINGFVLTQNCMNYDLRFFAKNGLKIDGHGLMGSVAKPAKSLEVLLNHLLQAFMAGATVFSGGQGYANFNSLLSVFARGRTYEEIKQAIQGFIFNCNMSLICRGGQVLFSSIGIDMSIPEVLKNEPAIGPGGVVSGVYGDYQEEADLIFRAILEVSNERDGMGAYHRFPNILINIREGDLDEYSGNCKLVHEIGANNPTLYYVNCTGLERTVMGCFSPDTSLWVKIDNQLRYLSFKEIDELLNADIGKTKVDNIEVLTVDDNKKIIWKRAKNFIKNKPQELYKVILSDGKSFVCDKSHQMISFDGLDKISLFDFPTDELLGVDAVLKAPYKVRVREIAPLNKKDNTYCFEVNDRIIVGDDFILTGNCRTALPMNWTGSYNVDCLNTGNFAYTTLNLPLIALDSNGDVDEFYQKLDEVCGIAYDGLIYRRNRVIDTIYNKHMSDFLLQEDKDTGKPLYDIDNTTITLGFCGLHECLKTLNNISDNEGEKIIKFLNSKKEEFNERDSLRWSVIASPAESTAHRFAEIIKEKYPDATVQGTKGSYYLTNSNHIPVSDDSNIVAHIKNAQQYNKLTLGGSILHLWLGEIWSDDKAIWSLNKKIVDSDVTFWAYSKVFTYCQECQFTINDNINVCPICGSTDLVTYDRCFAGDTFIYIKKDKIVKPVTLKDFVENYHVTDWQVPVFDYKTQSYIWSKVKRGIKNPPEPMINIRFNKGYEVTCTPNHNFYDYKTYKRKSSMYDTISANDLGIKSSVINHRCPIFLNNIEEDYLGTFIGFVLGDGNVTLQKNGKNVFIRLKFYKKEKSDYCKEILDRNNLEYTFSDAGIDERYNSQTYSYYIGANNIGNKAYDMFNMTRGNKKLIIDMCYNQDLFVGIFAGLINSDGSVLVESRRNSIVTTFNQVDRDILWLFYNIALLLGTNPSISFTERDGYDSVGRIEITSSRAYDILNNIILRSPFDEALIKGKCISDAKSVNGMCSVSSISESIVQNSYCIETEHDGHNTLFNGVLAENCTGYYLPTLGFNNGKQQEFKDRYRHKLWK